MTVNTSSYRYVALFAGAVVLLLSSMSPPAAAGVRVTHTVTIDGMQFRPVALTVDAGDSVVWVNNDPFPHTVTSQAGGFDSREIAPGKSWKLTRAKKGNFAYNCSLHPTMTGSLSVK